jgi:hypothetical protein
MRAKAHLHISDSGVRNKSRTKTAKHTTAIPRMLERSSELQSSVNERGIGLVKMALEYRLKLKRTRFRAQTAT